MFKPLEQRLQLNSWCLKSNCNALQGSLIAPRPWARHLIVLEPWRHRFPSELIPVRRVDLIHLREAHQNFEGSMQDLCSGINQRCVLECFRERSHKQLKIMVHPFDFLARSVSPPAQPRNDVENVVTRIKEIPRTPEREPKIRECDIRNLGASCFADMQEDLEEVTAATADLHISFGHVTE